MKKLAWICCILGIKLILHADTTVSTGTPSGVMKPLDETMILVHQGDAFFGIRTQETGAEDAVAAYEQALKKDPNLVEACWKASRAAHWIADKGQNKKNKLIWFEKGIAYAQKAIELAPGSVEAHFWLGANYGSYGENKGILKSLALVKPIRKEMETVVRLNDTYQGGAGYRVLGVVDFKVPPFAGGSKKRALENLNKAMAIDSTNPFNLYYMAEYYEVMGNRYKALDHLSLLEKCTVSPDVDEADLKEIQAKGARLKKKLD